MFVTELFGQRSCKSFYGVFDVLLCRTISNGRRRLAIQIISGQLNFVKFYRLIFDFFLIFLTVFASDVGSPSTTTAWNNPSSVGGDGTVPGASRPYSGLELGNGYGTILLTAITVAGVGRGHVQLRGILIPCKGSAVFRPVRRVVMRVLPTGRAGRKDGETDGRRGHTVFRNVQPIENPAIPTKTPIRPCCTQSVFKNCSFKALQTIL